MKLLSAPSSTHNNTAQHISVQEKSTEISFMSQHVFAETFAATMLAALAVHYTKKQMRVIKRKMLMQYSKNSFSSKSSGQGGARFLKALLIFGLVATGLIVLVPGSTALVLIAMICLFPIFYIAFTNPNKKIKMPNSNLMDKGKAWDGTETIEHWRKRQ